MSIQSNPPLSSSTDWLSIVRAKADAIRFGTIQVVIHDGKITQIESTEKTRLEDRNVQAPARKHG